MHQASERNSGQGWARICTECVRLGSEFDQAVHDFGVVVGELRYVQSEQFANVRHLVSRAQQRCKEARLTLLGHRGTHATCQSEPLDSAGVMVPQGSVSI
jgi:hypothetical protein